MSEAQVAGSSPSPETSSGEASTTTSPVTTTRPRTQPMRKAGPLVLALGEKSIRMTAMIGNGLNATPIAAGKTSPIAPPIARSLCRCAELSSGRGTPRPVAPPGGALGRGVRRDRRLGRRGRARLLEAVEVEGVGQE